MNRSSRIGTACIIVFVLLRRLLPTRYAERFGGGSDDEYGGEKTVAGTVSFRPATIPVLVFWLIAVGSSVCYAQNDRPQNVELKKKVCDFLSKADAESILGTTVEAKGDTAYRCDFVETGFTGNVPKGKQVLLSVWYWASPQANVLAEVRKGIPYSLGIPPRPMVTNDLPNFADAAIWTWFENGGTLRAFKGGTIQVEATVAGLPEDVALQQAKALAAKPLGGTARTGYVYAAPKSDAPAVVETKPPPVVPAPTPAPAIADTKPAPSPAIPIGTGKTFSQSRYMSQGEFLKAVKEVSMTFNAAPSLGKYISAAEQRSTLESELAKYGIAVRPNAPVSLLATVTHRVSNYTKTIGSQTFAEYPIHNMTVDLKFFMRAAALRNGKFHVVVAAPAYNSGFGTVVESNEFRKSIYGDDTLKEIREEFRNTVAVPLKGIASNMNPETKPWSVMSWTEKDKASVDAEFIKIMNGKAAMDKRQLDGLDTAPELYLDPTTAREDCAPDSSWGDLWKKAFQRVGLTEKRGEPTLLLWHWYDCTYTSGFTPIHFFRLVDTISLVEYNLVFELNGQIVRKAGELLSSLHSAYMLEKDIEPPTQNYFPRAITDFLVDLAVGRANH